MRRGGKQITLDFRKSKRGGARAGAGRKRKNPGARPNVSHRKRVRFGSPRALQVTVRLCKGLLSMRRRKLHTLAKKVMIDTRVPGFRICEYSLQPDHLHFIVEAKNRAAMTRGMRSLNNRLSKRYNALFGRKSGQVVADRYHEEILASPRHVKNSLLYVINNYRHHVFDHTGERMPNGWLDEYSSAAYFTGWAGAKDPLPRREDCPVKPAKTYLLRRLWRDKHGPLDVNRIPKQRSCSGSR